MPAVYYLQTSYGCVCVCVCVCVQSLSYAWLFVTPWTVAHQFLCSWSFPGKNFPGNWCGLPFPNYRGSSLLRDQTCVSSASCIGRQILYQLIYQGRPRVLEWVAYPFFSGSSRPRNWTRVSCIAGGFFTAELLGKSSLILTGIESLPLGRHCGPRGFTCEQSRPVSCLLEPTSHKGRGR